jgi:hypothetical protein
MDKITKSDHFTLFAEVAYLGETLQATKKRLRLIELVAKFLKSLSSAKIRPGAGLILGKLFFENQELKLEVRVATFGKILKELTGKKVG